MVTEVLANTCDVLMIVWSETRMYLLKQSLDHRPRLLISHFGQPMAAAVVAAPILRECDVVMSWPSVVSWRRRFTSRLFRNLLLLKVNSGPAFDGWCGKYCLRALTGQSGESFGAMRIHTPCRKGSVFEVLICMFAMFSSMIKSL